MPSSDRSDSRDRELVRHQHSFSSDGRSSVHIPMWDSSDPDRAPPPLPMNPGSPITTRPNTSALIANAAKALQEKAQESMSSSYTTNPMPQRSPERSLIKGATHKRMQSLQTTSVRDLRSFLDGVRSPERSPERSPTRAGTPSRDAEKDYFVGDQSHSRSGTPTPSGRDVFKDTPALRPSSRPLQKAILGENTPPSATMQALQTMTIPREYLEPPPLSNITNITNTSSTARAPSNPPTFDAISNQLLSITTIVSNLQKDMTQLSRRSKDNATDLVSLKEATSSRDEDIRKSLKDLVVTMSQAQHSTAQTDFSRSGSSMGYKDPHMTPTKQFTLPRIPSPNSLFMDDRIGSPNPYSVEGAASVAMLEKIIREMVTKDGQERLIANLQTLVDKATGDTAKKVTELVEFVKQGSGTRGLVPNAPPGSAAFQASPGSGALTRTTSDGFPLQKVADGTKPYASPKAADFVSDEMLKFLRKIKDSVAEAGCVTMGTKALIQDLRGEVLGMGRELARKIEEVEQASAQPRSLESGQPSQEVGLIVQEGLTNLKEHMERVMRERRRQSISSVATRHTVDSNEVYDVVKHALAERGLDQVSAQGALLDKEGIISAVREAYEAYQPDVKIEQFGLERDEVLQCLREGLQDYRGSGGVTREDIEDIVHDSIQHLKLPAPINEAHEIREEVLMAVRECLEDFKPSMSQNQSSLDSLAKEFIVEAIREGLASQPHHPQEVELDGEVLFEAVSRGLQAFGPQMVPQNGEIMQRLQEVMDGIHSEFKSYSSANGRDTEQVLDALRDGLDSLRTEIETYVDRAQDVTHKDEIVDNIRLELEQLRGDIQGYVAEGPRGDNAWSRGDMVGYFKSEFENLHEQLAPKFDSVTADKEELLVALNAGFEGMKSQVATRGVDLDANVEVNEAMKQEFDHLKEVILGDTTSQKDEILDRLQDGFDALQTRLGDSTALTHSNDEVFTAMKEEFEHLRETLSGSLVRSGSADKDDIIDAVRELVDGLRSHLESSQDHSSKDSMSSIQAEIEQLKESIGSTLVRAGGSADQEEILAALQSGLEDLKANSKSMGINEELLEAFRGELEQVRQQNGLTRQHARADTEEVLEAVRLGLDDLRSHMEKKLDNPESHMSSTSEIIDALNDGLEGLRSDVTKIVDKPVDMTVSYEILDTLKDGLASLREDMDKLKGIKGRSQESDSEDEALPTGNEVVLAEDRGLAEAGMFNEDSEQVTSREIVGESPRPSHMEKVEIMLSQLHMKVEAMDANIQSPSPAHEPASAPPGSAMKEDLTSIEALLKDLQGTVLLLQDREQQAPNLEGMATKEDTDAIETLLANMKAKMDEIVFPDPAATVTKENLDDVELVVRTTSEAIEGLAKKIEEEGATKGDVAVIQVIVDDIKVALDEIKAAKAQEEEAAAEKATKTDIDALSLLICDIKAKVDEMKIPDETVLPSKADLEQLTGLIHDFRDSHDQMRDSYEGDIGVTAKAFDDRRKEAEDLMLNLAEVKVVLDEVKEEIKTSLSEGGPIDGLKESFKALEDNVSMNFNVTADVKELMETVAREFERAHGSIEGLVTDQAEKSALTLEKHDEAKDAIIAGLMEKVDDRFNTLMAKYDDAQLLADEQARVMKEKAEEQEKILETTKTMADELRLSIDTLGSTIAGMNERSEESSQKLSADSAAVVEKIDETLAKLEEQKQEDKTEHSHTRDEIANVERIFTGLQDNITEYHPKFMVTLREIEALVKLHYEHSQKVKETAEEQVRTMNEEANARTQEIQAHFARLPQLLPAPPPAIEPAPTYDDAQLQEKLDKLLGHSDVTEKSISQLDRLDEIHKQVQATAAEVTEFVAKQTQFITDGNETKEREAEELALLVERRTAQKEQLDSEIESLRADKERILKEITDEKERIMQELKDDKDRAKAENERAMQELKEEKERYMQEKNHIMEELKEEKERAMVEMKEEKDSFLAVVAALQAERENLANQKVRLTGQVSSLHTALDIRREELNMMDAKADALERRILNGIMDHSRALMMAKGGPKNPTKLKKRMSADISTDAAKMMPPPSTAANGLSLALKPRPAIRRNGPPPNPASRRIFSLSQISGNAPTGAQAYPAAGNTVANNGGLKRSHSVKTNYLRKGSWHGRPSVAVANKENETLSEESETETEQPRGQLAIEDAHNHSIAEEDNLNEDLQSETGTERRHSIGTGSYAESYADGETPGYDDRSSYGGAGSDYSYGSGSYMTGSDIDRRTSYGSTTRSVLQGAETIDEGSEAEHSDAEHSDADNEDDEPTATIHAAPSEVNPSEVSTAPSEGTENMGMPTESEVDRAVEQVREDMKNGMQIYAPPSDSGVGTDLATAQFGNESAVDADYFRRQMEEEESTVG